MLSVTMVADVVVILLFTAAEEFAHVVYSNARGGLASLFGRFLLTFMLQISLSLSHAACPSCARPRSPAPASSLAVLS